MTQTVQYRYTRYCTPISRSWWKAGWKVGENNNPSEGCVVEVNLVTAPSLGGVTTGLGSYSSALAEHCPFSVPQDCPRRAHFGHCSSYSRIRFIKKLKSVSIREFSFCTRAAQERLGTSRARDIQHLLPTFAVTPLFAVECVFIAS